MITSSDKNACIEPNSDVSFSISTIFYEVSAAYTLSTFSALPYFNSTIVPTRALNNYAQATQTSPLTLITTTQWSGSNYVTSQDATINVLMNGDVSSNITTTVALSYSNTGETLSYAIEDNNKDQPFNFVNLWYTDKSSNVVSIDRTLILMGD